MTVLVNIKAKKKFDFTLGYIEEKKYENNKCFFLKIFLCILALVLQEKCMFAINTSGTFDF